MKSDHGRWGGRVKRVLLYKRTHIGDPNSGGCFGCSDCMKSIRKYDFDAVIGVGGINPMRDDPENGRKNSALKRKINWIGIGRITRPGPRRHKGPNIYFRKFRLFGTDGTEGPLFKKYAKILAHRMYDLEHPPRWLIIDETMKKEWREIEKVLRLALRAPASPALSGGSKGTLSQGVCRRRRETPC